MLTRFVQTFGSGSCSSESDRDVGGVHHSAGWVYLAIDPPQVVNRGPHLDQEVLQLSRLVEHWGAQNEIRNKAQQ